MKDWKDQEIHARILLLIPEIHTDFTEIHFHIHYIYDTFVSDKRRHSFLKKYFKSGVLVERRVK